MSSENFYRDLDLRYPELAFNKKPIWRPEPGIIPFYIPALYPNMAGGSEINNNISQNNSGLMNKEKPSIGKIVMSNYINIQVPRELCGYLNKTYDVIGSFHLVSKGTSVYKDTHTYDLDIGSSGGPSHSHPGTVTVGGGVLEQRDFDTHASKGNATGTFEIFAHDDTIPVDSAWIVVFLGGDINKPVIISRCFV